MPDQRTIWKRRAALMAVVGLVIAIPVTIAVRGGGQAEDEPAAVTTTPQLPELGNVRFDRDLGVELRLPEGWDRRREKDAVAFESPDGTTLIAISAPGPEEDAKPIQTAAIRAIQSQYRKVRLTDRFAKRRLGGRPARLVVISARHPKKRTPVRILVAAAKGEKRAYLVEVFASGPSALVEAQVLLNNLALEG